MHLMQNPKVQLELRRQLNTFTRERVINPPPARVLNTAKIQTYKANQHV